MINKSKMQLSMRHYLSEMMAVEKKRLLDTTCLLRKSLFISILLIICLHVPCFVFAASPKEKEIKNVLVVNSYHPGYEWSKR